MTLKLSIISRFLPFFALPDDNNMGGEGGGSDSDNQDGNRGGNDKSQQPSGKQQQILPDDMDISDLLADDDDDLNEDFDLGGDDDDSDTGLTEDQKKAGQTLAETIRAKISDLSLKESDIPENMDWTDRQAVAKFISDNNQNAVRHAIGLVPSILQHTLGIIVPKLEAKIQRAAENTGKKQSLRTAFDDLGFHGKDRSIAKNIFERAITKKMSPSDAAKATRNAMRSLGITGNKSNGKSSGRSGGGNSGGRLEGVEALDSLFGD